MTSLTDYADRPVINMEKQKMNYNPNTAATSGYAQKGMNVTGDVPITQEMTKRINALLSEVEQGSLRFHETADRVSGPIPETNSAVSNSIGISGGGCLLDELSQIISKLETINSRIYSAANRLQTALG